MIFFHAAHIYRRGLRRYTKWVLCAAIHTIHAPPLFLDIYTGKDIDSRNRVYHRRLYTGSGTSPERQLKEIFEMGKILLKLRFRILFFVLTCITIMMVDLIIVLINKKILSYKGTYGRHYITLIGMIAVLIIFYMFVKGINKVSEKFVDKFVHINRVFLGRQIGLYLSVSFLFLLIYAGYYWAWFDVNLFKEIWGFIQSVPSRAEALFKLLLSRF